MNNLYELLKKIQKRPSMYLGKPAISNLRSCLSGYLLARRELGIPPTKEEQDFLEFPSWLKNKFNISTGQSWDNIILFYSEDERTALNLFFELFEEFLQLNSLAKEEIDYSNSSTNQKSSATRVNN